MYFAYRRTDTQLKIDKKTIEINTLEECIGIWVVKSLQFIDHESQLDIFF